MLHGADIINKRRAITAGVAERGMVVGNVSWIMMVLMMGMLCARLGVKIHFIGRRRGNASKRGFYGLGLGWDDVFVVLAAVFSIAQTAAVSVQAVRALGRHSPELNSGQIRMFEKAEYASQLFYIASMGSARVSVSLLIARILSGIRARRTALALAIFSILWTVSGTLVAAFPCSLPKTWEVLGGKCIDTTKFVNYVGSTNIIAEMLLVVIPLVLWDVRISTRRSISVASVFLIRLSVIIPLSAHLVVFNQHSRTRDITYDRWSATLCLQLAQHLSIITACLPCLHPFLVRVLRSRTEKPQRSRDRDRLRTTNRFDRWLGFTSRHRKMQNKQRRRMPRFKVTGSQSSDSPFRSEKDMESGIDMDDRSGYCRPLATYGLDRSSAHLHSQHFNRFPSTNEARPTSRGGDANNSIEHVFMRPVSIPNIYARPITICDANGFPIGLEEGPKNLSRLGVLPVPDWDTGSESESERSSRAGSDKSEESGGSKGGICGKEDEIATVGNGIVRDQAELDSKFKLDNRKVRRPESEYVFDQDKVVSVAISETTLE